MPSKMTTKINGGNLQNNISKMAEQINHWNNFYLHSYSIVSKTSVGTTVSRGGGMNNMELIIDK